MDRGTWRATVHGVVKSWTRLEHACTHTRYKYMESLKGKKSLTCVILKVRVKAEGIVPEHYSTVDKAVSPRNTGK